MEVDLTPLQLSDMPVEVLNNIFEFLDAKSLKSSRLVSSKWNQIISKSPKLMKKFVLVIDDQREFHQISNFSRCFWQIQIQCLKNYKITENLMKDLREIGSKVKKVKIWGCDMSSEFEDLIRRFPSADHVEFSWCDAKEGFKFNPEVFAACQSLEVSCHQPFFLSFVNLQLTKFESRSIFSTDWQRLIDFLATQTRLKTLRLEIFEVIQSEIELVKVQCPVEKLSIVCRFGSLSSKLLEFVNLFAITVKSLVFGASQLACSPTDKPFAFLDSITSNFKSLTDLTLEGFMFTKQDSNLEFLKPLKTVNTMELKRVEFETSEEFSNFSKLFPQLAEIKLDKSMTVSGEFEKFLKCLFKLQHIKKFVIDESKWKGEDFRSYFVVLKNKHVSIEIGTKYDGKGASDLALKIFIEFDLPKDELMMSRHEAQESPEWKLVTDEDFQMMDVEDGELSKVYRHFSVVIQKH